MTDSKTSWERPVREVTLAARAEVLDAMAGHWDGYTDRVNARMQDFRRIWDDELAGTWHGDAGEAARQHWVKLTRDFGQVSLNYSGGGDKQGMSAILRDCAKQVRQSINQIPIPLFGGNNGSRASLPNGMTGDQLHSDGAGALYSDYQTDRSGYADGAFRSYALGSLNVQGAGGSLDDGNVESGTVSRSQGSRWSARAGDFGANERRTNGGAPMTAAQVAAYKKQVDAWYSENQSKAAGALDNLSTTYTTHWRSLPTSVLRGRQSDGEKTPPGNPPGGPPDGVGPGGAGPGSLRNGGGDVPSLGSLPPPATASPGAWPGMPGPETGLGSEPALSGPGSSDGTSGSGLAGIGASSPSGLSDPGLGSSFGGGAGASGSGSLGDLGGAGGGFGTSPVGSGPGAISGGIGPRSLAPSPEDVLASGRTGAGGAPMGMMGSGAGAGQRNQERDHSLDWLREDQDIWYDPDLEPPQIPWINGYRPGR